MMEIVMDKTIEIDFKAYNGRYTLVYGVTMYTTKTPQQRAILQTSGSDV